MKKRILTSLILLFASSSIPVNAAKIEDYTIKYSSNYSNISTSLKQRENLLKEIENKELYLKKSFVNRDFINSSKELKLAKNSIKEAKNHISKKQNEEAKKHLKQIDINLKNAQLYLMPSRLVESRALYLDTDSIPTTEKEIEILVKEIKDAGFNVIYPEVFRRGYTIYPNKFAEVDEQFKDAKFDILKKIVDEAHKNKLEVYPWVWAFRIKSPLWGDSFLKRYPEIIARRKKYEFEDREPLFISPASVKGRQIIANLVKDIAERYHIEGFLLDYIRYDETLPDDILTMQYFKEYYVDKYKKEPPTVIKQGTREFLELQLWRENQVTEAVKLIRREVKLARPNTKIGVAIFRTEKEGRLLKMQDWRYWSNNLYIDFICPMLYTDNNKDLNDWINSETNNDKRKDFLYPSLGAHRFNNNDDFYTLNWLLHKRNIAGMNIFSLTHFGRDGLDELSKGIFREKAFIPDESLNKSLKILLSDMSSKLKKMKSNNSNIKDLVFNIDKLSYSLPENDSLKVNDIKNLLNKIKDLIYKSKSILNPILFDEIENQVLYCHKLNDIYTVRSNAVGKPTNQTLPPLPFIKNKNYKLPLTKVSFVSEKKNNSTIDFNFWNKLEPLIISDYQKTVAEPEVETNIKLAYDKDNFYILYENLETDMSKIKGKYRYEDNEKLLEDDSNEFILEMPDKNIYKFAVSSNNLKLDARNEDISFNLNWKSLIKKDNDRWMVEFIIPFKELNYNPKKNDTIKGNFFRNRYQEVFPRLNWIPEFNEENPLGNILFN